MTSAEFRQEPHSCLMPKEGDPMLRMELMDAGNGEYLVLHAAHWAIEDEAEIDVLAAQMREMLARAGRGR